MYAKVGGGRAQRGPFRCGAEVAEVRLHRDELGGGQGLGDHGEHQRRGGSEQHDR